MTIEGLSDEDLIERHRLQTGTSVQEQWIGELFRRYYERVACWCLRLAGDREAAADLAQDVFLKAYRHLDSFHGEAKFSTWLYAIARNHCWNELKARKTWSEEPDDGERIEALADERNLNPEAQLERQSEARLLKTLMDEALDDVEKQVMTLHYAEELPLEAVTRLLGLTNASGAKAYVVSSKRKLNRAIDRWKARGVRI